MLPVGEQPGDVPTLIGKGRSQHRRDFPYAFGSTAVVSIVQVTAIRVYEPVGDFHVAALEHFYVQPFSNQLVALGDAEWANVGLWHVHSPEGHRR